MTKTSKSMPSADPARKQAVMYARVSSREQEKEGFSIPAQLKLKEYASANGLVVAQEPSKQATPTELKRFPLELNRWDSHGFRDGRVFRH